MAAWQVILLSTCGSALAKGKRATKKACGDTKNINYNRHTALRHKTALQRTPSVKVEHEPNNYKDTKS
jgi:hypothetical protein